MFSMWRVGAFKNVKDNSGDNPRWYVLQWSQKNHQRFLNFSQESRMECQCVSQKLEMYL